MKQKRGFTIIEVLAAIAIMMIIGGMLLLGGKYMSESTKRTTTITVLQNLKSLINEREVLIGTSANRRDINTEYGNAPATPLLVAESFSTRYPTATNAVGHTENIMVHLLGVPSNQSALANFPAKQFMKDAAGVPYPYNPTASPPTAPILLDGFKNPIIICPSTGLSGVNIGTLTNQTITSKDGQPFCASAGPDGDFSTGDDNTYSFEN